MVSQGSIDGLRHVLRALEGYAAGTRAGGAAFAFEVRPSLPPFIFSLSLFLSFSLSPSLTFFSYSLSLLDMARV